MNPEREASRDKNRSFIASLISRTVLAKICEPSPNIIRRNELNKEMEE